jgi:hypothetical protein
VVRGVGSDGAEARRRSFWLTTFSRDIRSYKINAGVNAVCGVRSGLNAIDSICLLRACDGLRPNYKYRGAAACAV